MGLTAPIVSHATDTSKWAGIVGWVKDPQSVREPSLLPSAVEGGARLAGRQGVLPVSKAHSVNRRNPHVQQSHGHSSEVSPARPFGRRPVSKRIRRLMHGGRWAEAWIELEALLASDADNPMIHWLAGLVLGELSHPEEALCHLRLASANVKSEPRLFHRLGELELTHGDRAAAERAFERAAALMHGAARLVELAVLSETQGNSARAAELLQEAHALEPANHAVVFRLACLLHRVFDPTPALKWAVRAVQLKEDHWDSYMLLGTILQRLGHLKEAVDIYHSLALVRPDYPGVNRNLGMLCAALSLNADAIRYFERAAKTEPQRLELDCKVLQQMLFLSEWDEVGARASAILTRLRSTTDPVSPFAILSVPGVTALDVKRAAERAALSIVERAGPLIGRGSRSVASGEADRKLRIGYMSCDFYEHATAFLVARLFEQHDREQYQLYAYCWDKSPESPLRRRIVAAFDESRDIRGLTDRQAAELIARDEVDILVDLKGYTLDGRLGILAMRPSPVQVHHVGFPGTLGAPFIDYLVADRFVAPLEHPEFFTEKIAYLPDCYQPNDETRQVGERPTRAECGLPESGVVFCCFNQTYKFCPEVFDVWCRLLGDVPGSVLWLPLRDNGSAARLRAEAERRGIASSRLVSAQILPQSAHLGRLQLADVALDTLPVNAHTTTSDAAWAGVPVVTLPGEPFVSRVAGSIMSTLGLSELVARDWEDYTRIAKELALNPPYLEAIRLRVREGCRTSPLFDSARYTRNLEALYRVMWRRCAHGLPPATIDVHGELQ